MSRRDVLLTLAVCIAVASTTQVGSAQCKDAVITDAEKRTLIAAPEYSKQIQETNAGKKTNYGLGWFIHDTGDDGKERQFEHSGGVAGSSSWLVIYPDQGVVIAWVQNSNDFRDWPIANVSTPFFSHRK